MLIITSSTKTVENYYHPLELLISTDILPTAYEQPTAFTFHQS